MKFKYVKPTLVLLIICVVISAALAATYRLTYVPPVTDPAQIVALMADDYAEVLPGSTDYVLVERTEGYEKLARGAVVERVTASNGCIVTVHSSGQYDSDPIRVLVGVGADGAVTGVKLLKISETPGMGMKTNNPRWLAQFVGGTSFSLDGRTGAGIDGVTSATKSSRAVVNAVNMAVEAAAELRKEAN